MKRDFLKDLVDKAVAHGLHDMVGNKILQGLFPGHELGPVHIIQ